MRALVLALLLAALFVTPAVAAGPTAFSYRTAEPAPVLSLKSKDFYRQRSSLSEEETWRRMDDPGEPAPGASLHLGLLTLDSGMGADGKMHLARYRLEGVSLLGGSISGSVDGRGARLFVKWRSGE